MAQTKQAEVPHKAMAFYINSEFDAMDDAVNPNDSKKKGKLSWQEVSNLFTLLGYSRSGERLKALGVKESDLITKEKYISLVNSDPTLRNETNRMRKWFGYFDEEGKGFSPKSKMLEELNKLDFAVPEKNQETVRRMDENHDKKISYCEFLKEEIRQMGIGKK